MESDSKAHSSSTGAVPDRADSTARRRWPLRMAAAALLILLAYVVSYFFVRTFSVTPPGSMFVVGMANFEYPGGGRAYALSKEDARIYFLFEGIVWRLPNLPDPPLDSPPRKGGRGASSIWGVYVPLERIELWHRGLTPVFLSDEEKASLLGELDQIPLPY